MSAHQELISIYQKWLEITQSEHQSIREKKWDLLNLYGSKKEEMMQAVQVIEAKNPDWKQTQPKALQILIHQLTDLEQLNHALLAESARELKVQINDFSNRTKVIQQLKKSYQRHLSVKGRTFSNQA